MKTLLKSILCISLLITIYSFTVRTQSSNLKFIENSGTNTVSSPSTITTFNNKYGNTNSLITINDAYTIPEITVSNSETFSDERIYLSPNASFNASNEIVLSDNNKTWFVSADPSVPPVIVGLSVSGGVKVSVSCFCNQGSGTCGLQATSTGGYCVSTAGPCAACGMKVTTTNGISSNDGNYGGICVTANSIKVNNIIY